MRSGVDIVRRVAAAAVVLCLASPAAAQDDHGFASFVLENDLFAGFDDDYTNGIQLSYLSGPELLPDWVYKAADELPVWLTAGEVRATVSLGQAMYTPGDITLRNPPHDDRPYAGWLYGAIGLIAKTDKTLDQLQLQVGVVGPAALGEQAQTYVHEVIDSPRPRGWSKQLHNEPGVVLTYQHSWHALTVGDDQGLALDVTPHIGGAIGNVFTYANAGATVRLGWNLPDDYGPPRIQPGLPGNGYFANHGDLGFYVFAGFDGRLVGRNIFLDGNTYGASRSVDKRVLVGDMQVGAALTWDRFRLAYTHVFRSEEFENQGGEDAFGAVSLTVRF